MSPRCHVRSERFERFGFVTCPDCIRAFHEDCLEYYNTYEYEEAADDPAVSRTTSNEMGNATPEEAALAHRYRWRLLACLFMYANPMRLADIATQRTVWERREAEGDALRE